MGSPTDHRSTTTILRLEDQIAKADEKLEEMCKSFEKLLVLREKSSSELQGSMNKFCEKIFRAHFLFGLSLLFVETFLDHAVSPSVSSRIAIFLAIALPLICSTNQNESLSTTQEVVEGYSSTKVDHFFDHSSLASSSHDLGKPKFLTASTEETTPVIEFRKTVPSKDSSEPNFDSTSQFRSKEEEDAVHELRKRLQDLRDECVHRPLDLSDGTLIRFARARRLDCDASEQLFRDAAAWRKEVNPRAVFDELEQHKPDIFKYTTGGWLPGTDREGSVIFIDRLGQLDLQGVTSRITQRDHERFTIWRQETHARLMEKAEVESGKPQLQVLVIQDLSGLSRAHFNREGFKLVQSAAYINDSMYPESLKVCFVVNAPRIFSMIWNVIKHFFDKNTRAKVQIHSGPATQTLLKYIAKENLPKFLGGDFEVDGDPFCSSIISPGGKVPSHIPKLSDH